MKLIDQTWQWEQKPKNALELIERAGRTCYKSESKITIGSAAKFVAMILRNGHHSVLEHVSASVWIATNRGVTHELVRHRLASYSQESTRYVNYGNAEMAFVKPVWWGDSGPQQQAAFVRACSSAETEYKELLSLGWRPEQAREVLPNALLTEIIMTANLREWRHIFALRTSSKAHPQMKALMTGMLRGFKKEIPVVFDDIKVEEEDK